MAFNRFSQVSPFKNVEAHIAKKEQWHSELPLGSTSHLDSSDGIKTTDSFAVARGHAQGTLIFLPFSHPGKQAQKAATFQALGRPITDFDTSYVEPLLASASDDGRIGVASLPSEDSLEPGSSFSLTQTASFSAPSQKVVEIVRFHPNTSGLLLTNQGSDIQVWDIGNGGEAKAVHAVTGAQKGHWSVSWSQAGRFIQTTGKDNTLNLWDVRQSKDKPIATTPGHQGFNKASRITSVNELIFTTGFSKMRDRECALWDPRNFEKPLKKQVIDTNTGVLMPLVDHARKMVYLVGRSDMTMRWAEVVNDTSLTIGSAPLPVPSQGAALLPSTSITLDVMQAEVQKLVVLSQDSIVPITMRVPRRSYLDFHSELFPPVQDYQNPAQDSKAWLDGEDSPPALVTPQPGKIWGGAATQQKTKKVEDSNSIAIDRAKVQTAASTSGALGTPELASVQNSTALSGPGTGHKASTTVNTAPSKQMSEVKITESKVSHDSPSSATTNAPTASAKPATETSTSTRGVDISARTEVATSSISSIQQPATTVPKPQSTSHTHWSRSFLAGKTHLKPEYEDVHNISNTIRASVQLLKANMKYLFYPLSGPGGRLGYHPVEKKGRLPVQIPCITSGHDIVDFDLDPFKDEKVFIAGSDGKIRVFEVKEEGESTDQLLSEASINLDDSMDRLIELAHHPNLADVILSASEDHGQYNIRVWDVSKGTVLSKFSVPGKGMHCVAWDRLGTRIAIACKDKKLRILDPRKDRVEDIITGPSHDSMRPVKVVWVNTEYLITCGFSRSAFREILLHKINDDGKTIEQVANVKIDVSPAPLFPYYDEDTNILFAYSKGERTCHTFEITNIIKASGDPPKIIKLSPFEHGTLQLSFSFLPKQIVNVKEVNILNCYRMTSNSIMFVKFNIPRAKIDYFQDDIYNGGFTRELMKPDNSLPIEEWMDGKDPVERFVNIRPEGMPLLSEAPPPPPKAKQQVLAKKLSEEETQKEYLDNLFKHKQAEVDSDEDEQRLKERDADDDDDW